MQRIGTKVTVTVPDDLLYDIILISERFEMSKAEVIRLLLETGMCAVSWIAINKKALH